MAQLTGAQAELSATIIQLRQAGSGPEIVSQGEVQLAALMNLKRQLDGASPATLATIRGDIAACVAVAAKLAQQAQSAAAEAGQGMGGLSLVAASRAAREAVASFEDDYYTKKKFDRYLRFASAEDEEEFRRREAERQKEIDKARSLHTPEADLRAATLSKEQLQDAGAHGASASPDFKVDMDKLSGAETRLANAISAQAPVKPTEAKTAAAEPDPLDAIKPSLNASRGEIEKLKSAGVVVAATGYGHGVSADVSRQDAPQRAT